MSSWSKLFATWFVVGTLTLFTGPFLTPHPNVLQWCLMAGIPLGLLGLVLSMIWES